jgi:hypothetical protein
MIFINHFEFIVYHHLKQFSRIINILNQNHLLEGLGEGYLASVLDVKP